MQRFFPGSHQWLKKYMQKIVLAVLLLAAWMGCKKSSSHPGQTITGNWELRKTNSASMGEKEYPAGNGRLLRFTETGYQRYTNGQLEKTGAYRLVEDVTATASVCLDFAETRFRHRIIYDNDTSSVKVFVEVQADTLWFVSGCYATDAGTAAAYVRVADPQ
jgi:hypothetical protein